MLLKILISCFLIVNLSSAFASEGEGDWILVDFDQETLKITEQELVNYVATGQIQQYEIRADEEMSPEQDRMIRTLLMTAGKSVGRNVLQLLSGVIYGSWHGVRSEFDYNQTDEGVTYRLTYVTVYGVTKTATFVIDKLGRLVWTTGVKIYENAPGYYQDCRRVGNFIMGYPATS